MEDGEAVKVAADRDAIYIYILKPSWGFKAIDQY